jgi:hypothetical protein
MPCSPRTAAEQERQQRQNNQNDQAEDRAAHHDMLEPEPRARTPDPNRAAMASTDIPPPAFCSAVAL